MGLRVPYASELRRIDYTGRIVSFEPAVDVFAQMEKAFSGDPLWQGYPLALGSKPGKASFNVLGATDCSSLLEPLPRALSRIAAGIAVGAIGAASLAAVAERPEMYGRSSLYP